MALRRSGLPWRRPPATGLLGHYPDRTFTGKPAATSSGHTPLQFQGQPSDHSTPTTPGGSWAPAPGPEVLSVAFALPIQARLLLVPPLGRTRSFGTALQASLALQTGQLPPPSCVSSLRFDAGLSPDAGSQLPDSGVSPDRTCTGWLSSAFRWVTSCRPPCRHGVPLDARRDHPVACARFAIVDRAGCRWSAACRRQSISEATRYRSARGDPGRVTARGRATRIRWNLSDAEEDTGHAVGWPGALQPPAPTDPGVTVSRHRALLISLVTSQRTHCQWTKRRGSRSSSPFHHR